MHELHELKETLCKELEEYGRKGEMNAGSLEVVDKLTRTIKNLDKIIDKYEDVEYSNRYYNDNMNPYDRSYRDVSYARGRNARRDARGRYSSEGYSRDGKMLDRLYELMDDAPDDRTRQEIKKLASKMEMM